MSGYEYIARSGLHVAAALVIDDLPGQYAATFEPRPVAAWLLTKEGQWVAPLGTSVPGNLPLGACVRRTVIDTTELR